MTDLTGLIGYRALAIGHFRSRSRSRPEHRMSHEQIWRNGPMTTKTLDPSADPYMKLLHEFRLRPIRDEETTAGRSRCSTASAIGVRGALRQKISTWWYSAC